MFFACGIWRVADVSSVSSSSEQTGFLYYNYYNRQSFGVDQ